MKDVWWGKGDGTVGVFGGHTSFGDARRFWDFRSVGRGMIDFESIIVALNDIGYAGPLCVEWEDSRMDRVHGATESAAFCKRLDFEPAAGAFDAAFDEGRGARTARPRMTTPHRKLRYAMVGGGRDAFIGAVHRHAIALDGQVELVAGALSSTPDKAIASGRDLGLARRPQPRRLASPAGRRTAASAGRAHRLRLHRHAQPPALSGGAGLRRGRLPRGVRQAAGAHAASRPTTLVAAVARQGTRVRRHLQLHRLPDGAAGARDGARRRDSARSRKVVVEYNQGWLATQLEASGNKQAGWRTDPARSGVAGAIGDIGSHAENLVATRHRAGDREPVRRPRRASCRAARSTTTPACCCAFAGGARGVLVASQIDAGLRERPAPARVRARSARSTGGRRSRTSWCTAPLDGPTRVLTRGSPWLQRIGAARRPAAGRPSRGLHRGLRQRLPRRASRTSAPASPALPADPLAADYPRRRGRRARRALHRAHGRVGRQRRPSGRPGEFACRSRHGESAGSERSPMSAPRFRTRTWRGR